MSSHIMKEEWKKLRDSSKDIIDNTIGDHVLDIIKCIHQSNFGDTTKLLLIKTLMAMTDRIVDLKIGFLRET